MMISKEERNEMLKTLDIQRWEFMPLNEGIISFINSKNKKVAEGKYEIILSHGPGEKFTMAYGIDIYKSMNAPIILEIENCPIVHENKTIKDAEIFAFKIGEQLEKEFVINAMHMFVGVTDFKLTELIEVEKFVIEDRIKLMLKDLIDQKKH